MPRENNNDGKCSCNELIKLHINIIICRVYVFCAIVILNTYRKRVYRCIKYPNFVT